MVTFAITVSHVRLLVIGLLLHHLAGYVFYAIAVLIIPAYILTEHAEVVCFIGSILALVLRLRW